MKPPDLQASPGHPDKPKRSALYLLILLSGAAGLVYEVVWARQLTLFLGNTAVANAAVLTAFMLGLAAGSLVLGRIADRVKEPLRLYALLEILIGCYGATTPWLFDLLQAVYVHVAGVVGVTGAYSHLPRFLVATLAMLVPTFMMGGTLPLLVRHLAHQPAQAQAVTSRVYGINTLGAMLGAFSAGFLLLPLFGISTTLLLAAATNLVVGLGVYLLLSGRFRAASVVAPGQAEEPGGEGVVLARPALLLAGFGLSGFAALLYQVVWIHSLVLVIGVSVYAFSAVLTVYLAGVGLGSLIVGRFASRIRARNMMQLAVWLQLGIALSAVVSLSLISQLPVLFVHGWTTLRESYPLFQAYMFLLVALVLFVPTLLLGALFPLVTAVWSSHKQAVGQGVGEAYGANAVGTIAGAAIGGLFMLDWLGIAGSLYLASAVSLLVAGLFWFMAGPDRPLRHRWADLPAAGLVFAMLILLLPGWNPAMLQAQVLRHADRYEGDNVRDAIENYLSTVTFRYYGEGIHGVVSVISWVSDGKLRKALLNNGKADAGNSGDVATQTLLGEIPMFLHDDPREVMVIGLGSGMTAGSVAQNEDVESIEVIEISPEVVEASHHFRAENHDVLDDPRTHLVVADARNYLLANDRQYDVIISEPSPSWVTGVSNLFTREFLQQTKRRLKEDGLLVQWYHMYGVDQRSLKSMLKAVSDVYPHYILWHITGGDLIITASQRPLRLDYRKKAAFFDLPAIRADFALAGIDSIKELINHVLMSSRELQGLLSGQESNTDENPIVEFTAPRYMYRSTIEENLEMLFTAHKSVEYTLPFFNLVEAGEGSLDVPFMGVRLKYDGREHTAPKWTVIRKSIVGQGRESSRLIGGMTGSIRASEPWGDLVVRTVMREREDSHVRVLQGMLEDLLPAADMTFSGEMKAPGIVVYWRVAPSKTNGTLRVALARTCERQSGFDDLVSFAGNYPGTIGQRPEVNAALSQVNNLVHCLPDSH